MKPNGEALQHAWSYFELHANQRITVFNYFIAFSGILVAGLASTIQASPRLAAVGIVLGLLLSLLSYIFWKLDQRTSFLIKHAEEVIKTLEPATAPIFHREVALTELAKTTKGLWTYSKAFRLIFLVMGLVGIGGAVVAGLRGSGRLTWAEDTSTQIAPGKGVSLLQPTSPNTHEELNILEKI